ncbi:MAG: M20/M25/M40 family metallo-hydrolase [Planctomycetota bacterium]
MGLESSDVLELAGEVNPETIAPAIPRCPGPFGGTTILVLPDDTPPGDVETWIEIESNDPLSKKSRFHRVRIVTNAETDGDRSLGAMLTTLESQGRKNVMIVPARFYAGSDEMQRLEREARSFADRMTLRWMPGLGGTDLPIALPGASEPSVPVAHSIRATIRPRDGWLRVQNTVTLPRQVRAAGSEFLLNSSLQVVTSSPKIRQVETVAGTEQHPERARYQLVEASDDGLLRITYEGTIQADLSDSGDEYARGMRSTHGIISQDGVFLSGASTWIPTFGDEMVRFDLEVEGPKDWHLISQGSGASDFDDGDAAARIARWESEAVMEQVYLVGGPMQVRREMAGSVEALVYMRDLDESLVRKYLDATARYIEMYRRLIGPYPYDKFALVENFWETGYGMPSFTLLGEQVIRLPFILHSSYPHEILHNWWGNSVFVDYETGNWCEGLTTYMADHLVQQQRGRGTSYRRDTLQRYRNFVSESQDFPLTEFRGRHSASTQAVGYGKSLMVFHMLRNEIGDDAFRSFVQDFYRSNRGKRASFADVRRSVESVTGEDFGAFFEQWISRTGAPVLALEHVKVDGPSASGAFTVTGSLAQRQDAAAYQLAVPLMVGTVDGQSSFLVEISSEVTDFSVQVDASPEAIAVDAGFDVFRVLDPLETPASVGQIFGESSVLAILPTDEDASGYELVLDVWRTDQHRIDVVLDTDIDSLPADRSIWILGETNRFADVVRQRSDRPDGAPQVMLDDEAVELSGHSIMIVRRHPENEEKAVGWIAIDPQTAFSGFARKLRHYGKYSYLAFSGDEPTNIAKGQWDTPESPLVHEFVPGASSRITAEDRPALAELPPVFSQARLMEHVAWLSSDQREGRGLGSQGLDASAEYIANEFESAGLMPGGDDGSWFQTFVIDSGPDGVPVEARNVIGVLLGSREAWADQSIVLGAHYDHLGTGWPGALEANVGQVHPGADDNASGVSVLLELARNMSSEGGGSRNLVFVAFSGEEAGLHGSSHYVANPRFPVDSVRGMINMDGVGRLFDGEISVHATGTADEWQHIFRGVGFVTGVTGKNIAERVGGSDQESFIAAGVPAVQVFTGAHADYHRPSDTAEKIDSAGLVKVATFVKEAVVYLIEREPPMTIRIDGVTASPSPASSSPSSRRVSFGTVPDFGFPGPGVRVDSIVPGSPAERAGLSAGDVLVSVGGEDIADLRAFSQYLRTLEPGEEVIATVRRGDEMFEMDVRVEAR